MSYVPRNYEGIVRDLLTTLTGGTVRESLTAPPDDEPIVLPQLRNRPVRRVSHLEGRTLIGRAEKAKEIPYRFTATDFELISTSGRDDEKDAIRFRKDGRKPVPGSALSVNYYPVQTDPAPVTDLNVGSVIRTLLEAVAREQALSYLHLQKIYDSAFVESAERTSLDKVVALVGVTRLPTGATIARIQFSRRPDASGQITVPTGTAVTDDKGNRFLTLSTLTLEPGESTREVMAGGEGTEEVEAGKLNRLELLIAGVSEVTNPQPAFRLGSPESDDDLRRRARGALHATVRGTLDAIRFGLLSIKEVNSVKIVEAPNGVPGEIRIDVAYANDTPEGRALVAQRIEQLRPAGIRVISGDVARKRLRLRVELTLAGSELAAGELASLQGGIESRLASHLSNIAPGGAVRKARLSALVLADARVTDARVVLLPEGADETEELTLGASEVLDVVKPFTFPSPAFEHAPGPAPAITAKVSATLPIHLVTGVTLADASQAIQLAIDAHLASRRADAPLTLDGLAAAIRDDTRFALFRKEALVTVESDSTFRQLTDGIGSYAPAANETLRKESINIPPREGGV
jgi:Baseplate J-like protein